MLVQSPSSTPALGSFAINIAVYDSGGVKVDNGVQAQASFNPYYITYTGFPVYGLDTSFAGTTILNLSAGTYTLRLSGSSGFISASGTSIPSTGFTSSYKASIYQASI